MAHLEKNPAAESTIAILTELIKAGRYPPAGTSITDMVNEAKVIKKLVEELHADKA